MPIFETIVAQRPDLFLFLGDNIYADTTDMDVMRAKYAKLRADAGFAKLMNLVSKEKINPIIGAAGVSAVPMAARVAMVTAQKEDPTNFLVMHAMGPNVAGVIGSAIAAGIMIMFAAS